MKIIDNYYPKPKTMDEMKNSANIYGTELERYLRGGIREAIGKKA